MTFVELVLSPHPALSQWERKRLLSRILMAFLSAMASVLVAVARSSSYSGLCPRSAWPSCAPCQDRRKSERPVVHQVYSKILRPRLVRCPARPEREHLPRLNRQSPYLQVCVAVSLPSEEIAFPCMRHKGR